jgi:hypothetical protein
MTVTARSAAEAGGADPSGTIEVANPTRRAAATAPLMALPSQHDARLTAASASGCPTTLVDPSRWNRFRGHPTTPHEMAKVKTSWLTTECCLMNAFMVMSPTNGARPVPRLRHQHHLTEH